MNSVEIYNELKDTFEPFVKGCCLMDYDDPALMDAWRIRDLERGYFDNEAIDYEGFELQELIEDLEGQYNITIEYTEYDQYKLSKNEEWLN